jgi:pyrroloquinoline quinone (PQQ) biosynthesis protein C
MTMTAAKSAIKDPKLTALGDQLVDMANAQHESYAYARLFSVSLTIERVRAHHLQKALWVLNRRACWAYVQAAAPFDVKQLIWQHEEEELGGDKMRGLANHYELNVKQGAPFGLTAADYANATPTDVTFTCIQAWIRLAKDSHWLKALAASAALELSNSDEILRTASASRQMAQKIRDELGIGIEHQDSFKEHMVADIEHSHLLMDVAAVHGTADLACEQILEGARESWAIDRVFRDGLAATMEAIR